MDTACRRRSGSASCQGDAAALELAGPGLTLCEGDVGPGDGLTVGVVLALGDAAGEVLAGAGRAWCRAGWALL
jgi:hypothetical protein